MEKNKEELFAIFLEALYLVLGFYSVSRGVGKTSTRRRDRRRSQ